MPEHPNATLIRRGYAAFNAGDVATLSQLIAHDAVQHMPGHNILSGDHKGVESILTMYGQMAEMTGGTLKVDLEEVYANDERVVTIYRGRAQRNGKTYDARHALVFRMRNEQAVDLEDISEDTAKDDEFWS